MSAFIDRYRDRSGVELICRTLGVSASAYYQRASGERSARQLEDPRLTAKIRKIFAENYEVMRTRWLCRLCGEVAAKEPSRWVERSA